MNIRNIKRWRSLLPALRAVSALWLSMMLVAVAAFVTQVFLTRGLTVTEYGTLAMALTAINLLSPIAGFGIGSHLLRVFGQEGWQAIRWLKPSLYIMSLTVFVAMLIGWAWAKWAGTAPAVQAVIIWLLPLLVSKATSELVHARLQLEERYRFLALWQVFPHLGKFGIAVIVVAAGWNMTSLAAGYGLLALILTLASLVLIWQMVVGSFSLVGHENTALNPAYSSPIKLHKVILNTYPFALAGIFYLVYFQSDIFLLGWLSQPEAAGIYNVAFSVMVVIYLLPSVIYQKYLIPKFHRWAEHDRTRFLQIYRFGNGVMLTLGLVTMVVLALVAPWAVPGVFGKSYTLAGRVLLILAICVPVRFLATSVGGVLVTQNHMRHKVWYQGNVALINVILNLFLIPKFSIYGAAVATVISEKVLLLLYLYAVRRYVFGLDAWRGWTLHYKGVNNA